MITERFGNVLDALEKGDVDIVLHVCNNKGVMGSGIAKEIRQRYPAAYNTYIQNPLQLGNVTTTPDRIVNMVAQDGYGKRNYRHLNYGALACCLNRVNRSFPSQMKIGIPYGMGAVRAGGDWEVVKELIEYCLPSDVFEVYAYKLEV